MTELVLRITIASQRLPITGVDPDPLIERLRHQIAHLAWLDAHEIKAEALAAVHKSCAEALACLPPPAILVTLKLEDMPCLAS